MRKKPTITIVLISMTAVVVVAAVVCRYLAIVREDRQALRLQTALSDFNTYGTSGELTNVLASGVSANTKMYLYLQDPTEVSSGQRYRSIFGSDEFQYPVNVALEHKNLLATKILLDYGANIKTPSTPMELSSLFETRSKPPTDLVDRRSLGFIKLFKAHGVNINSDIFDIDGLFEESASEKNPARLIRYLSAGLTISPDEYPLLFAKLKIKASDQNQTCLNQAILWAISSTSKCQEGSYETWVQYCISANEPDAVKLLVNNGFPIDGTNDSESALTLAIQEHEDTLIPFILAHGADSSQKLSTGENEATTCIQAAIDYEDYYAMVDLIKAGAVVTNEPVIAYAAQQGDLKMVQYGVAHHYSSRAGVAIQLPDIAPQEPDAPADSWDALMADLAEPIARKLAKSSNLTEPTFDNLRTLEDETKGVTISEDRNNIAKLLIQYGMDPTEYASSNGYAPLLFAAACDDQELVNYLTAYGEKVHLSNPAEVIAMKLWNGRHPSNKLPISRD